MIDFSDIISHIKPGGKAAKFQAIISSSNPNYNPHDELRRFFYATIYDPHNFDRCQIYNFLDYHANQFKGSRQQFIDFITKEIQPDRVRRLGGECAHITNILPVNDIIKDWIDRPVLKAYQDKYLAIYHHIMIALGREVPYNGTKSDLEALAKIRYQAKSGFYQKFIDYSGDIIHRKDKFVNNMERSTRRDWKTKIRSISNNDPEIDDFLSKYPD